MICQPNFRGIAPNRPFLTPRDIVEPHIMRLNHIENWFHAKFYVNQLFREKNLIGYIKNLIGNIYEKTHLSYFSLNLILHHLNSLPHVSSLHDRNFHSTCRNLEN